VHPRLLSHSRSPFPSRRFLIFQKRRPSGLVDPALVRFSRSLDPGIDTPCGAVSRQQQGREDQSGTLHRRRSQPCFHFTFGAPLAHFVTGLSHPASILERQTRSNVERDAWFLSSFLVKRIHSFPTEQHQGILRPRSLPSPRVRAGISAPGPTAAINFWASEIVLNRTRLAALFHPVSARKVACLSGCWSDHRRTIGRLPLFTRYCPTHNGNVPFYPPTSITQHFSDQPRVARQTP
jgi:hypothetical protein